MKLPGLEYRPARPVNASIAPLQRANQQVVAATQQAVQTGYAVLEDMADTRKQTDKANADLGVLDDQIAFEEEFGGKEFIPADDLVGTSIEIGRREEIPAHEARPYLLERAQRESILKRADSISDAGARQEWLARAQLSAAHRVKTAVQQSNSDSIRYTLEKGRVSMERLQQAGMFTEAGRVAESLPIDADQKRFLREDNQQKAELFRLNDLATSLDFQTMGRELERLQEGDTSLSPANANKAANWLERGFREARGVAVREEGERYYADLRSEDPEQVESAIGELQSDSYGGVFEEAERFTWINRLESGLRQITANQAAQHRVEVAQSKRRVQDATRLVSTGEVIDPSSLSDVQLDVEVLRTKDPASQAVLDFDEAMQSYRFVTDFQGLPLEEQSSHLSELRVDRSVEGIQRYEQAAEIHANTITALETDSMGFAARSGFYDVQTLPPANSVEFVEALAERDRADARIHAHYGKSSGPLTAIEAEIYAETPENAIVPLAAQVNEALEERAPLFWQQVIKGGGGAQFVAGEVASRPGAENPLIAERILAGRAQRKDLEWTEGNYRQMRLEVSTQLGNAFGADRASRNTYTAAVVDHYIAGVVQRGELDYLQPDGQYLAIDSDLLEDSVQAVTGGLIELEGMAMLAPEPGIKTHQVEDWIDSLEVDDLPFIRQADRTEALERIQHGDLQLLPSHLGRDKFVLRDTYTGGLVSSAGDPSIPAVLQWTGAVPPPLRVPRVP